MHQRSVRALKISPAVGRSIATLFVAGLITLQTGCIPLVANVMKAVRGGDVPAEFAGLKDQTVAFITVTETSHYSDDVAARMLNRSIIEILSSKVKNLTIVREEQVNQWRDTQGYNDIDYVSLGRGVKADKVVAIELTNLRLRDGQTMYRGRADITITVHNIADGSLEFRRSLEDYTYPATAAIPVTETSEERFRRFYLAEVSKRLARFFHPYDFAETVASDAPVASL